MGFTIWLLERRLRSCERKLERIETRIADLRARQDEGRITRGKAMGAIRSLEAKARHLHGAVSTVHGNLRRARGEAKKASH